MIDLDLADWLLTHSLAPIESSLCLIGCVVAELISVIRLGHFSQGPLITHSSSVDHTRIWSTLK